MLTITLDDLYEKGACHSARQKFYDRFGLSVPVCLEAALPAADDFNWWWAAMNLLSEKTREEYRTAHRAFDADLTHSTAEACRPYNETLWQPFNLRLLIPGYRDRLLKEEQKAHELARHRYQCDCAQLFVELYIKDHTPKPKTKSKKS